MKYSIFAIGFAAVLASCGGEEGDKSGQPCKVDGDCGVVVCDNSSICTDMGMLRKVQVSWTINGSIPGASNCTGVARLEVEFQALDGAAFGYGPVPCTAGLFSLLKMPSKFVKAKLTAIRTGGGDSQVTGDIGADGFVNVDIP
jgi:hypothetical protein